MGVAPWKASLVRDALTSAGRPCSGHQLKLDIRVRAGQGSPPLLEGWVGKGGQVWSSLALPYDVVEGARLGTVSAEGRLLGGEDEVEAGGMWIGIRLEPPPSCSVLSGEAPVWWWETTASLPVMRENLRVATEWVELIVRG